MLQRMLPLLLTFASLSPAQLAFPIFISPNLQSHLALTNAQAEDLQRNLSDYRAAQNATFERINGLNDDIRVETQKPAPDANALGARYAEIETMCRQAETPLRELQQRQVRVLNDEQRARLATLAQAQALQSVSLAAEGLLLIPPRTFQPPDFPTVFNGTPTRAIVTASPFFVLIGGVDIPPDLVAYLTLTEAQLAGLRQAIRAYQNVYDGRIGRIKEVAREIQTELAGAAPNAAALGESYREIEAQRRQIATRETETRAGMQALLTAAQRTRLAALIQPGLYSLLLIEAQSLRLILPDAAARPASRPSLATTVVMGSGFSGISSGLMDGTLSPADSIYRACLAGPEYEFRVPAVTPGPLLDAPRPSAAAPAPGSSSPRTE
ncbi:MAG: hypothetical protein IT162_19510 [Bryobacterales bacterium]|nr:hypothetical protein [Bryobacterales bacterium]